MRITVIITLLALTFNPLCYAHEGKTLNDTAVETELYWLKRHVKNGQSYKVPNDIERIQSELLLLQDPADGTLFQPDVDFDFEFEEY